jgi:nickel transport protein
MVLFAALSALACILAYPTMAQAHAVFIFAWPQGDTICTDSYFSKKSPVRGGTVSIQDSSGKVLDSAKTDDKGSVCFNRPQTTSDLTFVVEAGEGHRAEFKLRVEDLPALDPATTPSDPELQGVANAPADQQGNAGNASFPAGPGVNMADLRSIIRQELGAQLGPITKALAEADDKSPTLKDIIGGLGWLVGIFGLAFWYSGRKHTH